MQSRIAVVVEDDEDIRTLLEMILEQSGFTVHATADGLEGVELVKANSPDLVTLDLGLTGIDGFQTARLIREHSTVPIMILSARSDELDTVMGLECGADHYVSKPFRPRELRARVEAIMRRAALYEVAPGRAAGPEPRPATPPASGARSHGASAPGAGDLDHNGLRVSPETHRVELDGRDVRLTPTEFMLLCAVLGGHGRVLTKQALARAVRGEGADAGTFVSRADERTVEVHMGNLRRKLGEDPKTPRWIETVRGVGYRCAPAAC